MALALPAAMAAMPARAGSDFAEGSAATPLSVRAHLDFRVTVLPSIALRSDGRGLSVAGTQGLVLVQPASDAGAPDGAPATARAWRGATRVQVGPGAGGHGAAGVYTLVSP